MNAFARLSLAATFAALAAQPAFAVRTLAFHVGAFDAVCPGDDAATASVFSPFAFERDALALSDALEPKFKARYAETIGVLTDYEASYESVISRLDSARTNRFTFTSARVAMVERPRRVSPAYRTKFQNYYDGSVCAVSPAAGAESFLKAKLDGSHEDFAIPETVGAHYYDLVDVRVEAEKSLARGGVVDFHQLGAKTRSLNALTGTVEGVVWRRRDYTWVKFPLSGGALFCALVQNETSDFAAIREEFTLTRVESLLVAEKALGEKGLSVGPIALAIPEIDILGTAAIAPAIKSFNLPTDGIAERFGADILEVAEMRTRFRLGPTTPAPVKALPSRRRNAPAAVVEPPRAPVDSFTLDRPFFFFILHPPTVSLPAVGIFKG